jgi:salicylate hydroxylase
MSVEDGAVLARLILFTHLRTRDEIGKFLCAFQDIRQWRCAAVAEAGMHVIRYTCMLAGEEQELRDQRLRAKREAGMIMGPGDGEEETEEWREVKKVFAYDAEEAADNWWVGLGVLKRASATVDFVEVRVEQTIGN